MTYEAWAQAARLTDTLSSQVATLICVVDSAKRGSAVDPRTIAMKAQETLAALIGSLPIITPELEPEQKEA